MFAKNNYINNISLFLLGMVSLLFMVKYSARVTTSPLLFSGLFLVIFFFLASSLSKINFINHKIFNLKAYFLFFIITALALIIGLNFIPAGIESGRYTEIKSWLDNFRYGFYPYDSKANPSGFPFLFMFALPFYLLGDAGYLAVFGFILFAILLRNASVSLKELYTRFCMLLVLPVFYYEYLVRSELFTNMVLFIAISAIALKKLDIGKTNISFFALSILFGLLLSTRLVIFIVYFLFLLFVFRNQIVKGMLFGAVSVVTFALTLIPFIAWNSVYFWSKGPFAIQFLYLPMWVIVIAPFLLLYIGWMIRDTQELMFASGIVIFVLVSISFIIKTMQCGFYISVIENGYDISYFAMSIPFLLLSIKEYKVDRYLGKELEA